MAIYNGGLNIKNIDLLNSIYPVGSIYMTTSTSSPASLFGGTWEQLKDKFLLGAGSSYAVNTTGGESVHTLTTKEMPQHSHSASSNTTGDHTHSRGNMEITGNLFSVFFDYSKPIGSAGALEVSTEKDSWRRQGAAERLILSTRDVTFTGSKSWSGTTSSNGSHAHTITIDNTGSGNSHNNMPPYLVVYMWKRTK